MSDTGRSHGDYYILIGGHRIEMVGNQNPMNGTNETFFCQEKPVFLLANCWTESGKVLNMEGDLFQKFKIFHEYSKLKGSA